MLTEKNLVEDHIVDEEEQQVVVDTTDTFSDVSNGQNSNNNQATYLHSFFQYDHETNVFEENKGSTCCYDENPTNS